MRALAALAVLVAAGAVHASPDDAIRAVRQNMPAPPAVYGAPRALTPEQQKALSSAFEAMERARVLDGSDEAALSAYAEAAEALQYTDLAAAALQKLTAFTPDDPDRWRRLGKALSAQGPTRGEAAFEALARSRALNPEDARTHYLIGSLYHRQGLHDAAAESYARAKELPIARVGLAVLKVYGNDIIGAENDLKALGAEAQPLDVQTRLWLRDALEVWEHSGRVVEDTAAAHAAFARLLYRAARLPEAVLALRRATVLAPEDADQWNLLGAIFSQLGDLPQARQAYESSLDANPDQPDLRKALESVKQ